MPENLWTNDALVPIEPMGFTTKEADEEIGVTYFGERWLIPRLGRWATPDPLHIHASGGGETGNSYHYVSGNLLQAVDPWELSPGDADSRAYVADSQGGPVLSVHEGYDANGDPFMTFTEVGASPYELGLLQRQADIQAWQEGRASDPIEREAAPQIEACEAGCGRLSVSEQRALQVEEGLMAGQHRFMAVAIRPVLDESMLLTAAPHNVR